MSLLARLGRPNEKNIQVRIFTSQAAEAPADSAYQQVKKLIHQRIVEEMSPEEQRVLSAVHQDVSRVEMDINN